MIGCTTIKLYQNLYMDSGVKLAAAKLLSKKYTQTIILVPFIDEIDKQYIIVDDSVLCQKNTKILNYIYLD